MGEKDITEKTLAAYNDVFADIVNVLLFDGKEVISPEKLSPASTVSQYKADGKIHEQERDVSKYVNGSNAIVSLIGFENQTMAEKLMSVITGDRKFEEGIPFFKGKKGVSMESILDRVQNKGISIGVDRGISIGYTQGEDDRAITVYNNCLDRGMTEADAIAISEISDEALKKARKQRAGK